MITLKRTSSTDPDFIELVRQLDADLAERDGKDHAFYAQFNKVDQIKHVIVAFNSNLAVGCGAIKEYNSRTMEVKRIYTAPGSRGKGIASRIVNELEKWAAELGYATCILETGKAQPEAIALYKKNGYQLIPNYGQYAAVENSVCFEKAVS